MIDIHCHILPGIDDGAVDFPDAMGMARDAVVSGCRAVFATSHLWEGLFGTSPELLRSEFGGVVARLREEGIPLELFPGAENHLANQGPEEFAEKAVPLGEEGRYVLLDFSLRVVPRQLPGALEALRAAGCVPVIAHPERNEALQSDPTPVEDWIAGGAVIQVNAGSLLGRHGERARKAAERLIGCGAAHVLASDAHDRGRRSFCLGAGRDAAARIVGEQEADRMARERPRSILCGEALETAPVTIDPPSRVRRFLRRWRRRG